MEELDFIETFLVDNAMYVRSRHADKALLQVTAKTNPSDLLTEADLTVQQHAVEHIAEAFPGDRLVAEEGDFKELPTDAKARCWVLDPVDGTNNFVRGLFPIFAISIAFCEGGHPQAAGVVLPGTGDIFLARRGAGARRNGAPMQVSSVSEMEQARLDLDFGHATERRQWVERAPELIMKSGQIRCHGSAVAALCQVATGDLDATLHMGLQPWDYAAAQLIVEEAGGKTSRLDGSPLEVFDGRKGVLISNGLIHQQILDLLK